MSDGADERTIETRVPARRHLSRLDRAGRRAGLGLRRPGGRSLGFLAALVATFFVVSAGVSAAYLTASEIFPMETRALAIAFFYAIGTAAGGIVGPLLFGSFIGSGDRGLVATGFLITAGVTALGGIAELVFGVRAEQESLEDVAEPISARDADPA